MAPSQLIERVGHLDWPFTVVPSIVCGPHDEEERDEDNKEEREDDPDLTPIRHVPGKFPDRDIQ